MSSISSCTLAKLVLQCFYYFEKTPQNIYVHAYSLEWPAKVLGYLGRNKHKNKISQIKFR